MLYLLIFDGGWGEGGVSLSSLHHISMVLWLMCTSKKGQTEFIECYQLNTLCFLCLFPPEPMLFAKPGLQSLLFCFYIADNQSCVTTLVCLNSTISSYTHPLPTCAHTRTANTVPEVILWWMVMGGIIFGEFIFFLAIFLKNGTSISRAKRDLFFIAIVLRWETPDQISVMHCILSSF